MSITTTYVDAVAEDQGGGADRARKLEDPAAGPDEGLLDQRPREEVLVDDQHVERRSAGD
jgi:hypothetical protein